jgi:hypothetical protein
MSEGVADGGDDTVSAALDAPARARAILEAAWRPAGYTSPNRHTYPWQWLWDSCFHAIVWGHLGDDRALVELSSALAAQHDDGFVPHMNYWGDDTHDLFWSAVGASSITQPPMYGHALAELVRLGFAPDEQLLRRARSGMWHLLRAREPHPSGLVRLCHPWESGADDSPRWDHWCPGGFDHGRWFEAKGALVASIERYPTGSPRRNPAFDVAPVGFNALIAFNARELATVVDDPDLAARADELAARLEERWDTDRTTWIDAGTSADDSGRIRTADALLVVLCTPNRARAERVLELALDDHAFGGACGPSGVHRDEPTYSADTYWRGPAWPQLAYLLWVAARRHGLDAHADDLARRARRGATRSGFAEYWDPDDGRGLGAIPQSWTTLTAVMAASEGS